MTNAHRNEAYEEFWNALQPFFDVIGVIDCIYINILVSSIHEEANLLTIMEITR